MQPLNATIRAATCAKAALPFDLVLRLAGVLGRNDPISFALKLTRSYNPGIWKALDDLGVGKLVVQAGRERDFANLYRANDASQPSESAIAAGSWTPPRPAHLRRRRRRLRSGRQAVARPGVRDPTL